MDTERGEEDYQASLRVDVSPRLCGGSSFPCTVSRPALLLVSSVRWWPAPRECSVIAHRHTFAAPHYISVTNPFILLVACVPSPPPSRSPAPFVTLLVNFLLRKRKKEKEKSILSRGGPFCCCFEPQFIHICSSIVDFPSLVLVWIHRGRLLGVQMVLLLSNVVFSSVPRCLRAALTLSDVMLHPCATVRANSQTLSVSRRVDIIVAVRRNAPPRSPVAVSILIIGPCAVPRRRRNQIV